jgi:hypothetical protein
MERNRDLARPEVRPEVAADLADRVDDVLPHLLRDGLKLVVAQAVQVLRLVYPLKKVGHPGPWFDSWFRTFESR